MLDSGRWLIKYGARNDSMPVVNIGDVEEGGVYERHVTHAVCMVVILNVASF